MRSFDRDISGNLTEVELSAVNGAKYSEIRFSGTISIGNVVVDVRE
jgi:hypothetical protein